jgi:hypothetical protein
VAALDAKLKEERKRGDDQVRLKSFIWTHITWLFVLLKILYYNVLSVVSSLLTCQLMLCQALYYAGIFLLHVDRADKAKEYVDR